MDEQQFPQDPQKNEPDRDAYDRRHSYRDEKDEKDEKSYQKHDEKNWEEKWRRDPLSGIVWALVLVWAGVVLLLANMGHLGRMDGTDPWQMVMLGAGVILLLSVLFRLLVPEYRRAVIGTLIVGLVFVGIGLGNLISWDLIWPIVIIAIGLVILMRAFSRRR